MKILNINALDIIGGAARAAYRLHQTLLQEGIESRMLVQHKMSDDYTVLGPESRSQRISARIRPFLDLIPVRPYKERNQTLFSPAWVHYSGIAEKVNALDPDIVHLHWICNGMMRFEDLAKIKAPIVWSLHDMWAFTGGCHYDQECGRYTEECGKCFVLGSKEEHDLSRKILGKKRKVLRRCTNVTINGLSRWLARCAQESALFKDNMVVNLPNPINTNAFKPADKIFARKLLNLRTDKKLILFGAMSATSDPRKGFRELKESLQRCKAQQTELVVFGSGEPKEPLNLGVPAHYLGQIRDDASLAVLYSAVDVMVVPSLQENLSNVIMESLACGTPVVAFEVGGNSDMIDHKVNGYLARPKDAEDLAAGIEWVLNSPDYDALCRNAREKTEREFESSLVAGRYIELYNRILDKRQRDN